MIRFGGLGYNKGIEDLGSMDDIKDGKLKP